MSIQFDFSKLIDKNTGKSNLPSSKDLLKRRPSKTSAADQFTGNLPKATSKGLGRPVPPVRTPSGKTSGAGLAVSATPSAAKIRSLENHNIEYVGKELDRIFGTADPASRQLFLSYVWARNDGPIAKNPKGFDPYIDEVLELVKTGRKGTIRDVIDQYKARRNGMVANKGVIASGTTPSTYDPTKHHRLDPVTLWMRKNEAMRKLADQYFETGEYDPDDNPMQQLADSVAKEVLMVNNAIEREALVNETLRKISIRQQVEAGQALRDAGIMYTDEEVDQMVATDMEADRAEGRWFSANPNFIKTIVKDQKANRAFQTQSNAQLYATALDRVVNPLSTLVMMYGDGRSTAELSPWVRAATTVGDFAIQLALSGGMSAAVRGGLAARNATMASKFGQVMGTAPTAATSKAMAQLAAFARRTAESTPEFLALDLPAFIGMVRDAGGDIDGAALAYGKQIVAGLDPASYFKKGANGRLEFQDVDVIAENMVQAFTGVVLSAGAYAGGKRVLDRHMMAQSERKYYSAQDAAKRGEDFLFGVNGPNGGEYNIYVPDISTFSDVDIETINEAGRVIDHIFKNRPETREQAASMAQTWIQQYERAGKKVDAKTAKTLASIAALRVTDPEFAPYGEGIAGNVVERQGMDQPAPQLPTRPEEAAPPVTEAGPIIEDPSTGAAADLPSQDGGIPAEVDGLTSQDPVSDFTKSLAEFRERDRQTAEAVDDGTIAPGVTFTAPDGGVYTVTEATNLGNDAVIVKVKRPDGQVVEMRDPGAVLDAIRSQPAQDILTDGVQPQQDRAIPAQQPETTPTETVRYQTPEGFYATEAELPTSQIGVLEGLQYKTEGIENTKTQTTGRYKDVKKFDRATAGRISVWEDNNGKFWVMNGHHRLDIANRTNTPTMAVTIFSEKDGVTFDEARGLGAMQNIKDGKGTALDAATVIRDLQITAEDLAEYGISTSRGLGRDALALSSLPENARTLVQQGKVRQDVAARIAEIIKNDPVKLDAAITRATELTNRGQAEAHAYRVLQKAKIVRSDGSDNLFGDIVEDVAWEESAKISDRVAKTLAGDSRAFKRIVDARPAGATKIDKDAQIDAAEKENIAASFLRNDAEINRIIDEESVKYAKNKTRAQFDASVERVTEAARAKAAGDKPRGDAAPKVTHESVQAKPEPRVAPEPKSPDNAKPPASAPPRESNAPDTGPAEAPAWSEGRSKTGNRLLDTIDGLKIETEVTGKGRTKATRRYIVDTVTGQTLGGGEYNLTNAAAQVVRVIAGEELPTRTEAEFKASATKINARMKLIRDAHQEQLAATTPKELYGALLRGFALTRGKDALDGNTPVGRNASLGAFAEVQKRFPEVKTFGDIHSRGSMTQPASIEEPPSDPEGTPATQQVEDAPSPNDYYITPSDLPTESEAAAAYQWSSFRSEERGKSWVRGAIDTYNSVVDKALSASTEDTLPSVIEGLARFKEGYIKRAKAALSATSRTASAMVTGPARFPTARNNRAVDVESRRMTEWVEFTEKAEASLVKLARGYDSDIVKTGDTDAVEKLTERAAAEASEHQMMVDANKRYRSATGTHAEKTAAALEGLPEHLIEKANGNYKAWRYEGAPFLSYDLNNARARANRNSSQAIAAERLAATGQREATADGVRVLDNPESERVQIFYDGIPDPSVRDSLKKRGFRWSPSNKAWQRPRTERAWQDAKELTGAVEGAPRNADTDFNPDSVVETETISPNTNPAEPTPVDTVPAETLAKEPWEMTVEELADKYKDFISDGIGFGAKYDRNIDSAVGDVASAIQKGDAKSAKYFGAILKLRTGEWTREQFDAFNGGDTGGQQTSTSVAPVTKPKPVTYSDGGTEYVAYVEGKGEQVELASGRIVNGPKWPQTALTNRNVPGRLKRIDDWLVETAIEEARLHNNEFMTLQFEIMKGSKSGLSKADRDSLNDFLFAPDGMRDGAPDILKDLAPSPASPEPDPEPQAEVVPSEPATPEPLARAESRPALVTLKLAEGLGDIARGMVLGGAKIPNEGTAEFGWLVDQLDAAGIPVRTRAEIVDLAQTLGAASKIKPFESIRRPVEIINGPVSVSDGAWAYGDAVIFGQPPANLPDTLGGDLFGGGAYKPASGDLRAMALREADGANLEVEPVAFWGDNGVVFTREGMIVNEVFTGSREAYELAHGSVLPEQYFTNDARSVIVGTDALGNVQAIIGPGSEHAGLTPELLDEALDSFKPKFDDGGPDDPGLRDITWSSTPEASTSIHAAIQNALDSGEKFYLRTYAKTTEFGGPGKESQKDMFRVNSAGELQVKTGKSWDTITGSSKMAMATDFKLLPSQQSDIEAATPQPQSEPVTDAETDSVAPTSGDPADIEDFGEYIPGSRKELAQNQTASNTGPKDAKPKKGLYDGFIAAESMKNPGEFSVLMEGNPFFTSPKFNSLAEAEAAIPSIVTMLNHSIVEQKDGKWGIARKMKTGRDRPLIGGFESREAAMTHIIKNPDDVMLTKVPRYSEFEIVERVTRKGRDDVRGGKDIKPNDFQDTFGFRGGQFGNWNKGAEGQRSLNLAYEALYDLASVTGLSLKAVSLSGDLAIAFGARGHGATGWASSAPLAHFEPKERVINLTKEKGAGALAHEWAHALDAHVAKRIEGFKHDYVSQYPRRAKMNGGEIGKAFADVIENLLTREKVISAEEGAMQARSQSSIQSKHLDNKIAGIRKHITETQKWGRYNRKTGEYDPRRAATETELAQFDALVARIESGDYGPIVDRTPANANKFSGIFVYEVVAQMDDLIKSIKGRGILKTDSDSEGRVLNNAIAALEKSKQTAASATESKTRVRSDFYKNALYADETTRSSYYYSLTEELLARAFQSYVSDKLRETGGPSEYLNTGGHGMKINPFGELISLFPEGAERAAINQAFDNLFEKLAAHPEFSTGEKSSGLFSAETDGDLLSELAAGEEKPDLFLRGNGGAPLRVAVSPLPTPPAKPEIKSAFQLITELEGLLNKTVFKMSPGRGALGSYDPRTRTMRMRRAGDFPTALHEAGHMLDDVYQLLPGVKGQPNEKVVIASLVAMGDPYTPKSASRVERAKEGVAAALSAYALNPDALNQNYPALVDYLETKLPAKLLNGWASIGTSYRTLIGLPPLEQSATRIAIDREDDSGLVARANAAKELMLSLIGKLDEPVPHMRWDTAFTSKWFDNLRVFENTVKKVFETGDVDGFNKILPSQNPIGLVRDLRYNHQKVDDMYRNGVTNASGQRITRPVIDILSELKGDDDNFMVTDEEINDQLRKLFTYGVAKRHLARAERELKQAVADASFAPNPATAKRIISDAIEHVNNMTGFGNGEIGDVEQSAATLAQVEGDPAMQQRFDRALEVYYEVADGIIDYLVEKGRFTQDAADAIRANNDFYVAMQRVMDSGAQAFGISQEDIARARNPIKKFKGSTREIVSPLESLIANLQSSIYEADRNEGMALLTAPLKGAGTMYADQDPDAINALDQIAVQLKVDEPVNGRPIVTVYRNGVKEQWLFNQAIFDSMTSVGHITNINGVLSFARALTRLIKNLIIFSPKFIFNNVIRDSLSRAISTRGPLNVRWAAMRTALKAAFRPDPELTENLFRYGGYLSDGLFYDGYSSWNKTQRNLIEHTLRKDKNSVMSWRGFKNLFERAVTGAESFNRRIEYKQAYDEAIKKGLSEHDANLYAGRQARDLLDFTRAGEYAKTISAFVPFFNASMQGLSKTTRTLRGNTKRALVAIALYISMPSLIQDAYIAGQPIDVQQAYHGLPDYRKDLFWNWPAPGKTGSFIVIPKSYEYGIIGSSLSRLLGAAQGRDERGYFKSLLSSVETLEPTDMVGPLKPVVEAKSNVDFFRGRSIVPPSDVGRDPALTNAKNRASTLGGMAQDVTGEDARIIDHVMQGFGGNWYRSYVKADKIATGREFNDAQAWTEVFLGILASDQPYADGAIQQVLDQGKRYGIQGIFTEDMKRFNQTKDRAAKFEISSSMRMRSAIAIKRINDLPKDLAPEARKAAVKAIIKGTI